MISSRYALWITFILIVALIPIVTHSYLNLKEDDGLSVKSIKSVLDDFESTPTNRMPGWGKETFGSEDWIERIYNDKTGKAYRLFVGRSYDNKRLYHHPELALSYAKDLRDDGVIWFSGKDEIPVKLLQNETGTSMAAFVLLYNGKFIENPILHQITDSLRQLFGAKKQMTLFYIVDDHEPKGTKFIQTSGALLLNEAIVDFMTQQ